MKKKRFTEEQIVGILHEAAGSTTREVCRKHGITETTFYRWRAKYGGLQVSEARRLKRLVAELALDNAMLKDVVGRKW